jgi:hypothetical protein
VQENNTIDVGPNWHYTKNMDKEHTMVKIEDIRVGSVVIVRGNFGNGQPQRVVVEAVEDDIKNGRPGIDYDGSWAYLNQVDRVVKY